MLPLILHLSEVNLLRSYVGGKRWDDANAGAEDTLRFVQTVCVFEDATEEDGCAVIECHRLLFAFDDYFYTNFDKVCSTIRCMYVFMHVCLYVYKGKKQ
jgi:hypothetical protein